jgi:hypothetical protein
MLPEHRLNHGDGEAERFYRDLEQTQVTVRAGIEAGHALCEPASWNWRISEGRFPAADRCRDRSDFAATSMACNEIVIAHANEIGRFIRREQYGNNLGRKPSQMIPNDPKSALHKQPSFQLGPLILSHLGPLVGGPEKAGVGGSIPSLGL